MPPFASCCVLIPCSTIEDFPSQLARPDARGLLASLSIAWHPALIAAVGGLPEWRRADDWPIPRAGGGFGQHDMDHMAHYEQSITGSTDLDTPSESSSTSTPEVKTTEDPEGETRRLVIVSPAAGKKLPTDVWERLSERKTLDLSDPTAINGLESARQLELGSADQEGERMEPADWLWRVDDRADAARRLAEWITPGQPLVFQSDAADPTGRTVAAEDFYALAYTWWQVQILTRRLRYSSNLDQQYFESRVVDAARGFIDGDAAAAAEGLHDAFDALAEERDHYFASDPSLIDLTLVSPGTLPRFLDHAESPVFGPTGGSDDDSVLPTPRNVLIDDETAKATLDREPEKGNRLRDILDRSDWGFAGGGPAGEVHFDLLSLEEGEVALAESIDRLRRLAARPPRVHARRAGSTPPEAIPALLSEGCVGWIPVDFTNGVGFGDESKVIMGSGGHEIEALAAKPIDADDDAAFLSLATRLGESIDSGDVATGLIVHWPGGGCDSFGDLRRAASWTLALGKFWKLDEYFTQGEHPYHHGHPRLLTDPISSLGPTELAETQHRFTTGLTAQARRDLLGMAHLLAVADGDVETEWEAIVRKVAEKLGWQPTNQDSDQGQQDSAWLILNPHNRPGRGLVEQTGSRSGLLKIACRDDAVFRVTARSISDDGSGVGSQRRVTTLLIDAPSWGFASVGSQHVAAKKSSVVAGAEGKDNARGSSRLMNLLRFSSQSFGRRSKPLLETPSRRHPAYHFGNEFMEVTVDPRHGGINGVYSGKGRGNRLSARLVRLIDGKSGQPADFCVQRAEVISNDSIEARLRLTGTWSVDPDSTESSSPSGSHESDLSQPWQVEYSLQSGSRLLSVRFRPVEPMTEAAAEREGSSLWSHRPVWRVAFAEATPIIRAIVREKLHRLSARSFVAPAGYVVEEDERQTLVATYGNAVHRRVGERFIDTRLLAAWELSQPAGVPSRTGQREGERRGEQGWQRIDLGMDIPYPLSAAHGAQERMPACRVQPAPRSKTAMGRGWLMHTSPATLLVQVAGASRLSSETGDVWALHLRLIQTYGRSVQASVEFCRPVISARMLHPLRRPFREASQGVTQVATDSTGASHGNANERAGAATEASSDLSRRLEDASVPGEVRCREDRIELPLNGHGVTHVLVKLRAETS